MKIVTVLGARPQFVKASVVSRSLAKVAGFREVLVHTGQHFDHGMSDIFFDELGISQPDHFLGISGGSHGDMTGRMLAAVERVLLTENPDAVLVYGDTNSTLAGALAAVKLHIPIAHVEAGLRSFNNRMPEEINRVLTDRISRWLFTPTDAAAAHLRREGCPSQDIYPVGDVMFDVALHVGARVRRAGGVLSRLSLEDGPYVLMTVHRAENTDNLDRLHAIVEAAIAVAAHIPVVWPIHPRTRALLQRARLIESLAASVNLLDPVGYLEMVQLEKFAAVIATDSGGVQKEAFFYRVPCVTLRDETEWIELLDAGWNRLVAPISATPVETTILGAIGSQGREISPYGDGDAASKIVDILQLPRQ